MIITVSVQSKRMKIVIRVFEEKNLKESGDYKLIKKACKVITLADTKSLFDSPPLTKNVPVEDVSFDQIIPEKVPALKGIELLKTKKQWLRAYAYFSATLPYNDKNITDIKTKLEKFQHTLYNYF